MVGMRPAPTMPHLGDRPPVSGRCKIGFRLRFAAVVNQYRSSPREKRRVRLPRRDQPRQIVEREGKRVVGATQCGADRVEDLVPARVSVTRSAGEIGRVL